MKRPALFLSVLFISILSSTILVSTLISGICTAFYKDNTEKNVKLSLPAKDIRQSNAKV